MADVEKNFVSFDEIANEMSESEYLSFLNRLDQKGYENDAERGNDGQPINVYDIILSGVNIFNSLSQVNNSNG